MAFRVILTDLCDVTSYVENTLTKVQQYFSLVGLTGSVDDTEDTIATRLLRMKILEAINAILQQKVDT